MSISRHNYEEYFILYMDNELGAEERHQVEWFAQQNPDLKEELELLLQSKFTPESHIVFENKDELLRTAENSAISMSNYEEWLVLYMDNELSAEEKTAVEDFVASHPAVKAEFEILAKTKLQPEENIVFPDKELLYRKTERVSVIQMRFWGIAVAAMLILGIGISTIFILSNRKTPVSGTTASQEIKSTNKTTDQTPIQKKSEVQNNSAIADNENKNQATNETIKQQTNKTVVPKAGNNILAAQKDNPAKLIAPMKNEVALIADNTETNNLPSPANNPNTKIITSSSVPDVAANDATNKLTAYPSDKTSVTNPTDEAYKNKLAPENTNEKSDATYASLDEGDNKKTRGFFRKVTRFFERTTKINPANDDDKVLIGALAVKMK